LRYLHGSTASELSLVQRVGSTHLLQQHFLNPSRLHCRCDEYFFLPSSQCLYPIKYASLWKRDCRRDWSSSASERDDNFRNTLWRVMCLQLHEQPHFVRGCYLALYFVHSMWSCSCDHEHRYGFSDLLDRHHSSPVHQQVGVTLRKLLSIHELQHLSGLEHLL